MKPNMRSILLLAVIAGSMVGQSAMAATQSRLIDQTGANMCQLSIPTTDTKVRPKATGFNNEGTTNAFVICAFDAPPGSTTLAEGGLTGVVLYLKSLDGLSHTVTCTGVNSIADGADLGIPAPTYVAKTLAVNDTGTYGVFGVGFQWTPADFGGTTTIPFSAGAFSVTCLLPPQVSIKIGGGASDEDVGS